MDTQSPGRGILEGADHCIRFPGLLSPPHTWLLRTTETYFLTVLEARRSNRGVCAGWFSLCRLRGHLPPPAPGGSGLPWLVVTSLQSLHPRPLGLLPRCVSHKDTCQGPGAHPESLHYICKDFFKIRSCSPVPGIRTWTPFRGFNSLQPTKSDQNFPLRMRLAKVTLSIHLVFTLLLGSFKIFISIEFIGVTLVYKIIGVSGIQFYTASSVYCIGCSPPQVRPPSVTYYPPLPSSTCPLPFPSGNPSCWGLIPFCVGIKSVECAGGRGRAACVCRPLY